MFLAATNACDGIGAFSPYLRRPRPKEQIVSMSIRIHSLAVGIVVFCTLLTSNLTADDALVFKLDPGWTLANRQVGENERLMEFVPNGETIENWSELCTLNDIRMPQGVEVRPDAMAQIFREMLEEKAEIKHWQILARDDQSVTVAWKARAHSEAHDQFEMMRYIIGEATIYRIAFTTKAPSLDRTKTKKWLSALQAAELKASP